LLSRNFGNDQQPTELAIIRQRVPHVVLAEQYPEAKPCIYDEIKKNKKCILYTSRNYRTPKQLG
jgi:hypothetical protein